jgi:hypothetical protein
MIRHKRIVGALVVGGAVGLVGVLGMLPAIGQKSPPSSPVILLPAGNVVARGAAATASAYVVCHPGDYASLTITLSERSGKHIASGSGRANQIGCSGQIQTIRVTVIPHGATPFVKGSAFARARFEDCGYYSCGQTAVSHNIKLKTKKK